MMYPTLLLEVSDSNPSQGLNILTEVCRIFLQSLQANATIVTLFKTRQLSTTFLINNDIILSV